MLLLAMLAFQAAPVPQAVNDKDPVICTRQNVGTEVGTHMRPKKVCMKKSEWEFLDHNTKNTLNSINNSGNDRERFTPTPR